MSDSELGSAEYLCYEVVRRFTELGRDVPKTDFNKFCFLAYKNLPEDVDVPLPHYWYQYGEVVEQGGMNTGWLSWESKRYNEHTGYVANPDPIDSVDFNIEERDREEIDEAVEAVVREYKDSYGTDIAKNESYELFAPNEFIRTLNELRDYVEEQEVTDNRSRDKSVRDVSVSYSELIGESSSPSPGATEGQQEFADTVESYLDSLVRSYPDEYTHGRNIFGRWESVCRQMLRNEIYSDIPKFIEDFWMAFSRIELRIRHNENISFAKRREWIEKRESEKEEFMEEIQKVRAMVLEERDSTNKLGEYAESYSQVVRSKLDRIRNEN